MPNPSMSKLIKALTDKGITATTLSDDASPCVVSSFLSSGCYVLDMIMGGGFPLGRVVEIYGDTSTGKSLIAEQTCACVQEDGGDVIYIDTETAVSLPIVEAVGADVDNILYASPDTVEEVFKIMETAIEAKDPDRPLFIVWDSIAASSSKSEMEGETGDVGYLTHSRVISQGMRRLTRMISKHQVACCFLNQAKEAIGVLWGDKVATFGGKAIGFHSSIRIMMTSSSKITGKKKREIGVKVKAKVTKNKIAPPFREAVLPIYFGYGIDDALASFLYLKEAGVIKVKGSWHSLPGIKDDNFREADWYELYDKHYEAICDMIDKVIGDMDLI